jgi:hypothetical protein
MEKQIKKNKISIWGRNLMVGVLMAFSCEAFAQEGAVAERSYCK